MNKLKPCPFCESDGVYQETAYATLSKDTFGEHVGILVSFLQPCPPFAKCGSKGFSPKSFYKIRYCPDCGKPLSKASNPPLTLDELREMDGEPVWVKSMSSLNKSDWHKVNTGRMILVDSAGGYWNMDKDFIGRLFIVYRHKPETEDNK